MEHYKRMYVTLFKAVTLAMQILEDRKNIPQAIILLKHAQLKCEEIYLDDTD